MIKYFAIISNDIVINIIVADSLEDAQIMYPGLIIMEIFKDAGSPGVGWKWNGSELISPYTSTEESPVVESSEE